MQFLPDGRALSRNPHHGLPEIKMQAAPRTLVDVIRGHAARQPEFEVFTVLGNGEAESGRCTFAQLDSKAMCCARQLRRLGLAGQPAVLLFRDPLEFIESFVGCLYAGVIAVPAAPPASERQLGPMLSVLAASGAPAILCARQDVMRFHDAIAARRPDVAFLYPAEFSPGDDFASEWPAPEPGSLAFLQYTSGSTGNPKGVQVTHANLMANEAAIRQSMDISERSRFVGWLPLYHDMGLIGNVLQPLYLGISCVLMPPMAFMQRPVRWLQAISRYRATISGAPNFAYDLCVEKVAENTCADLDLSSWRVAFNGSEPVRAETLERFAGKFARYGFQSRSFFPCYGMAECTLIVTGVQPQSEPVIEEWHDESHEAGLPTPSAPQPPRRKRLVSCGSAVADCEVAIVDPKTLAFVPDGTVGEIWIRGGSVSSGYWRASPADSARMRALPAGGGPDAFLRSGDLGYLRDGNLFVTGRISDVIIVRGRNHYPQDLEATAASSNAWLAPGGGAAFVSGDRDAITVVHELTRSGWPNASAEDVSADIIEAISGAHGLRVARVVLIKPSTLPRTSSGKVQRKRCAALLAAGALDVLDRQPGLPAPASGVGR